MELRRVVQLAAELLGPDVVPPLTAVITEQPSLSAIAAFRRKIIPPLRPCRTYSRLAAWLRANLRQLYLGFGVLNRKLLHVSMPTRRTPTCGGLMIAILGSDGAGKSAVTKEVVRWLTWKVDALSIYFGSGDGRSSALRLPLKLGLQLFRKIAGPRSLSRMTASVGGREPSFSARRWDRWLRALAIVLWALVLSYEKRGKLRKATKARNRGMIVVCDRLPQKQVPAVNDGPLLSHWLVHRSRLFRTLARWEYGPYAASCAYPPDLVLKLVVTPQVALTRKPEMSIDELQRRVRIVERLKFPGFTKVIEIDADKSFDEVVINVKRAIWQLV